MQKINIQFSTVNCVVTYGIYILVLLIPLVDSAGLKIILKEILFPKNRHC